MDLARIHLTDDQSRRRDEFIERMLPSTAGLFDVITIYLGHRLGYDRVLVVDGPLTSAELASQTDTYERYAREWLEQQTVAGILDVEDPEVDAKSRLFSLPPGHATVLVSRDSLDYMTPLTQLAVSVTRPMDALIEAYRRGDGVPLKAYGRDFVEGQAEVNRAAFLYQLGSEWLPAIPDVHQRLTSNTPARVADIGCGGGWSSIGIAQAYPNALVDGYDLDLASIALARVNLADSGLGGRVAFHVRDAGDPALGGQYDLVTAFECIHDMANPVAALQTRRSLAAEGGAVLVVDERVGDAFTAGEHDIEWMMYGWSVLHCLPVGMADQPSANREFFLPVLQAATITVGVIHELPLRNRPNEEFMNGIDILKYGNLTVLRSTEGISLTDWDVPGVTGYWSVKNIISHLASFEWMQADLLKSLTSGGDTPVLDMYIRGGARFNDIQVDEMRAALSPQDALAEYKEAFARSHALFAEFPQTGLRQNGILPWYGAEYDLEDFLVYTFYGHKREHSAQINHFRDDVLEKK